MVQAYLAGPKNVNLQETGPMWLKFEQVLSSYEPRKRYVPYLLSIDKMELCVSLSDLPLISLVQESRELHHLVT